MTNESSPSGVGSPSGSFAAAYRVLSEAIKAHAFPGCAFGMLAEGDVVLQDALGRFTYDAASPAVTAATVYDVASITKVVATTAAAMLLWQRGVLDLDMPLADLVPAFSAGRGANDRGGRVRLRHLLAHSSGLPGHVEFFRTAASADELADALLRLPLEAEPGTRAEYSDPGFMLLGMALEKLVGEPLDKWVGREVFLPLGMRATGFCPAAEFRPGIPPTVQDTWLRHRMIQGEVQDENAWVLGGVAAHAGVFSSVPDLLRFAREILTAEGTEGAAQVFQGAAVATFAERQGPAGSSSALGWDTPSAVSSAGRHFTPTTIGHLGYSGCSLWIDREARVAAVLLTNRTWPDRKSQLIREIRPAFHNALREALSSP